MAPAQRNGFFDSKVLSRQHAEVWEENGKVYIKDVKSSNGTFINGEQLSSEGHESEPFELKSDNIVEFGIDIVGEDNISVVHHKVATRLVCVFSEQDTQVAARAEQHQQQQLRQHQLVEQQQQQQEVVSHPSGPSSPSAISGIGCLPNGIVGGPQNFPFTAQRPKQLAQQGLGSMGSMRPPGRTGLSFDVILSRLQGEVQKSRETGAELNSLTSGMNEIHDTLGGAVPANLPPLPTHLPPVRLTQDAQGSAPAAAGSSSASLEQSSLNPVATLSTAAVVDLQSQLWDTQSSLTSHLDKVHALQGVLAEQEAMKHKVSFLREMMEERRREEEVFKHSDGVDVDKRRRMDDELREVDSDDEDNARSISTVMPHELERMEEEDEEQMAEEERQELADLHEERDLDTIAMEDHVPQLDTAGHAAAETQDETDEQEPRREDLDLGRPRTPEPTHLVLRDDGEPYPSRPSLLGAP